MIGPIRDSSKIEPPSAAASALARRTIIGIAILLAVSVLVAAAAIVWFDRERDLVSAEREQARLSLTLAETTSRTMQSLDLILLGIEEDIENAGIRTADDLRREFSSPVVQSLLVERKQDIAQLDAIVVLGDNGHVITSSRTPPLPSDPDFSTRDYYLAHKSAATPSVYIGAPVRNRVTGEWTMFMTRPISAPDGAFLGVLNAVVRTRFFEDLFEAVAPGSEATISLFRRDGVLLARHPMSEEFIGRSFGAQPLFREIIANAASGVVRTPASAFDGIARIMTPNAVSDYPLVINVTNTIDAILASWRQRTLVTAVISSIFAILILLFGALFGRQIDLRMRMAQSLAEREEASRGERRIRELAEDLEKSLKQLRAVTDHLPVLIAYIDRDMKFRFINKTGEIWYGRSAEDILGHRVGDVLERPPTVHSAELFERLSKGPIRDVRKRKQPDGTTRTLDVTQVPDFDADGNVCGYYALLTDISDRVATEEQLRQAQKLDAIGKLTGGIAHDFNNLLAVILGNLELAKENAARGEDPASSIDIALHATDQGAQLTRSLLSFARQQSLSPTSLNLSDLVNEMISLLQRTLPENIAINVVATKDLWACHADPSQVKSALLNLVVNSRDAMPSGGKLTIETANVTLAKDEANADIIPGDYVMLAVSDTGSGMPPAVVAQAFEPFFTTKEMGRGTGLGLSMVYGFAKQSNGNVKIYSEVGHGTSVKLYLPRSKDGSAQSAASPSAQAKAPAAGETILVVEDNADVRILTTSMLQSLGYRVLSTDSPGDALQTLSAENAIDLLLTDVVLSDPMNGPQLAAAAIQLKPSLKILFMSGYTENALKHNAGFGQNIRLLQKPFRKADLAQALRDALDRA